MRDKKKPVKDPTDSADLESSVRTLSKRLLWLLYPQALSWWILVYWLFGLLWYPPRGDPLLRFAILYGLLVMGTLPVAVALTWAGRRLRQLPLRVTGTVAAPALLWIVVLALGTSWWDEVVLSVVAVQVVVAAYFLGVAGLVVVLRRRIRRSRWTTNRALAVLLAAQVACYSIEVWRLTAYAHPAGGRLLKHALFSNWTFVVALAGTLLGVIILLPFGKSASTHKQ